MYVEVVPDVPVAGAAGIVVMSDGSRFKKVRARVAHWESCGTPKILKDPCTCSGEASTTRVKFERALWMGSGMADCRNGGPIMPWGR